MASFDDKLTAGESGKQTQMNGSEEQTTSNPAASASGQVDSSESSTVQKSFMYVDCRAMRDYVNRGYSKDELVQMAIQQIKGSFEETNSREEHIGTEEDRTRILEKADCASPPELLRLLDQCGVRDPYGTLATDSMRRERLRYHLNPAQHTDRKSVAELLEDVQYEATRFQRGCEELWKVGTQLVEFLENSIFEDDRLKECITRDLPKFMTTVKSSLQRLEGKECPILVTGEVSVGKSTFLNLLFEGQGFRLPQNQRETTSCICEIRYGEQLHLLVHRNNPPDDEEPVFKVDKVTDKRLDELINYERIRQGPGKLPYKKVEIFAPLDFLKCGLVLIDTPGVGSDRHSMEQFIEEYLQHSVGFIYVLQNAVNVHNLCRLFKLEKSGANKYVCGDDDVEELSAGMSRNTLFVANKWDIVEEESTMMSDIQKSLKTHWLTDKKDTSRVLKLAATKDLEHFKAGYVSDRLQGVIESFKTIVPHNMKLLLRRHYRCLQLLCAKVEYHCQRFLNIPELIKQGRLQEVIADATRKLERMQQTEKEKCLEFEKSVSEIDLGWIAESLEKHLKKPEVRSRIIHWEIGECPEVQDRFVHIEESAKRRVEGRIRNVIEEWNNQNHYLDSIRNILATIVHDSLNELDTDVTAITRVLTPVSPIEIEPPGFRFGFLSKPVKYVIQFLQSLLSQFIIDTTKKGMFTEDPVRAMQDMSEATLKSLFIRDNLVNLISKALGLDQVVTVFKGQVHTVIGNLKKEVHDLGCRETSETFMVTYKPLRDKCLSLHTALLKWELDFLFEGDTIKSDDVEVKEVLLGSGIKTGYYAGRNTVEDKNVTVKRYAKKSDLRAILQDYKCLKKHESKCIGTVLGMVQIKMERTTELVLVMEPTWFSLEDWLKSNIQHLGAYQTNPETTKLYTLKMAYDVSEGLAALHSRGYVHTDLSPSTIMVTCVNSQQEQDSPTRYRAKLFHFGVRNGVEIPISCSELPLALTRYCAPERVESIRCHFAMDIYSLGQILADFWFGTEVRAFNRLDRIEEFNKSEERERNVTHETEIQQSQSMSLEKALTERPENEGRPQLPPHRYYKLIRKCCDLYYNKRPSVTQVLSQISDVSRELDRRGSESRDTGSELERNDNGTLV